MFKIIFNFLFIIFIIVGIIDKILYFFLIFKLNKFLFILFWFINLYKFFVYFLLIFFDKSLIVVNIGFIDFLGLDEWLFFLYII